MPTPPKYKPQPGDPRYGRSAITNGSVLLPGVDGRSPWVRRCRDIIAAHTSDIPDANAAERSLIRRASVLSVELEQLEQRFATGDADAGALDLYIRGSGGLRRLLEAVGLRRRQRDVETLDGYLATQYPPEAEDAAP
jgi:hypothetical protein